MAKLDDRKLKLRYLSGHPYDNYDNMHFSLAVGNYRYMFDQDLNLIKYDEKTYYHRSWNKSTYYAESKAYHYTFKFKVTELDAVFAICKDPSNALIYKNLSQEVDLFARTKLKYFPKHLIDVDDDIKLKYLVDDLNILDKALKYCEGLV